MEGDNPLQAPLHRQYPFSQDNRDIMDIDDIIAGGGMTFRPERKNPDGNGKVKTKAKKKKYVTGAHGSGSARQKAKYREQRANRHKGK